MDAALRALLYIAHWHGGKRGARTDTRSRMCRGAEVAQADEGIEINEPTKTSLVLAGTPEREQQISPLLCILTNVFLNGPFYLII